jgi:hypothetical protein
MVNVRAAVLSADARWILGLAREPPAEAVVSFQITDLPPVGHGILQDADQAHSDSCSRPESRETLLSMTRLMRHPIEGCGSLTSSSGVMSPNVRCSDSWTRVNASSKISFAIMKVPSVACAYYKSKVRFNPFKSFNSSDRVSSGAPLSFPFPIEGKGIKQDAAICSHFHSVWASVSSQLTS